jgi:hypothetical protein
LTTLLLASSGCASTSPAPAAATNDAPASSAGAEATKKPAGEQTTYDDPHIYGHPVGQCVTGQGWGALVPSRCDSEAQRVVADQFCGEQQSGATAVTWTVQHGPKGRHSIWMYERGTPPERGTWTHGLAIDRFATIVCSQP